MDVPEGKILYFGVKASVIGDFCLKAPIITRTQGFQTTIFIEDGCYKIMLIKRVGNNDALKLENVCKGNSVTVLPEETAYLDYIRLLQRIEAIGGFNYGIRKILYQNTLEIFWCFGDRQFGDLITVLSAKKQYDQPKRKLLSQTNLSSIILLQRIMPDAIIPYNFYREGVNYLNRAEYRLAYLHFYMILEYCFIKDNNYSKKNESDKFENNLEVEFAILHTIKLYRDDSSTQYNWLVQTIKKRYKTFTLRNIVYFLFNCRGEIAHGTQKAGHYSFNESELANITNFIHQLCITICGNMQVYCEVFTKSKNKRLSERRDVLKRELSDIFDS